MPKLTIDGKEIEVADGLNLIQAAEADRRSKSRTTASHPGLSVPGNCRMCLVEVEKAPKLQIACNTKVTEGMIVHTQSAKTKTAQKAGAGIPAHQSSDRLPGVRSGRRVQTARLLHGVRSAAVALSAGKKGRKGKAIPIGSDVMLDQERCVLCARCTRFFDEVTHTSELAIFERGDHNEIDIYPGHPVNNKYAGNVIDICPVGALTEKDFRFRMRVWYLHRATSVCGGCERGCAIDIHHQRAPHLSL